MGTLPQALEIIFEAQRKKALEIVFEPQRKRISEKNTKKKNKLSI